MRKPVLLIIISGILFLGCSQNHKIDFLEIPIVDVKEYSSDFVAAIKKIIDQPLIKEVDLSKSRILTDFKTSFSQLNNKNWIAILFPEKFRKIQLVNLSDSEIITIYNYVGMMKSAFESYSLGKISYESSIGSVDLWLIKNDTESKPWLVTVDYSFDKIIRVSWLGSNQMSLGKAYDYVNQMGWMEYRPTETTY